MAVFEQAAGAAAVTIVEVAVVAGLARVQDSIAAHPRGHAHRIGLRRAANAAGALSIAAAGLADFQQTALVAAVASVEIAVVASLAVFEYAVSAVVGRLAGVRTQRVAGTAGALVVGGAGLAVFQQTTLVAAVSAGETAIVASLTVLEYPVSAGIGGLASGCALGLVTDAAYAVAVGGTAFAVLEQAARGAAIAALGIAIVTDLAGFDQAVAANIGVFAHGRVSKGVADPFRAVLVGLTGLPRLEFAEATAIVLAQRVAVVASFAGLELAVTAGIGGLAPTAIQGIADSDALGIVGAGLTVFEQAAGAACVAVLEVAIVASFASLELAVAAGIGGLAGMATEEIADGAGAL